MSESEHAVESGYGTTEHGDIARSNLKNAEPEPKMFTITDVQPVKTGKVLLSETSDENGKMVADEKDRGVSGESEDTLATAAENEDTTETLDDDAYGSEEDTAALEKKYFAAMVELKVSIRLDIIIDQACDDQQNPLLRIQRGGGYVGLVGMVMSEEEAREFWKVKHLADEAVPFTVIEQFVSRNYQNKLIDNFGRNVSAVEFAAMKIYEHMTCEAASEPTEENNMNEEQAAISSKVPTSAEMEQTSNEVKRTNCEAEETSSIVEAASEPTGVNSISEEQVATSSKVPTSAEIDAFLHELPTLTAVTEYDHSAVTFKDGLPSMVGGKYTQMNIGSADLAEKKKQIKEDANAKHSKDDWYVTKKIERAAAVALAFICRKEIVKYSAMGKDIPADVFRSALEEHKSHPLWFVISSLDYQRTLKDTLRSFVKKHNKDPKDNKFDNFVMEGRQMLRDFMNYCNE